ncbi:hypothetical protein GCM10027515_16140 [Schumannella luteola]|uniref:Surface antigen n=1 Tax=Schumannella luteola TaxID=472059 RepID=A0A852YC88_9MICO|nr:hypothetical protein [Schumannella luteola]NYH00587.1 surface antigen [Schumannella luteola]TPX04953.1 hypothetical protein FJ656_09255 [Schumannella luteola]
MSTTPPPIEQLLPIIQKLPQFSGIVWRGAPEGLGGPIVAAQPFSGSLDARVASENFTAPVLLAIVSLTAREIGVLSANPAEQEIVMLPGTGLAPLTGVGQQGGVTMQLVGQLAIGEAERVPQPFPERADLAAAVGQALTAGLEAPTFTVANPGRFSGPIAAQPR